jgi:hypothetical protein
MASASEIRATVEAAVAADMLLAKEPSVVTYSRLEPLALTSGDLAPGLEGLLGDPLWLLGRQWQFEELRGEDAGSPVLVRVQGEHAPVSRFHPGAPASDGSAASASEDAPGRAVPVEVVVEAEEPLVVPERVRAQTGLQLLRLLAASDLHEATRAAVRGAVLDEWAFASAPEDAGDPVGSERRRVLARRVPDGAAISAALVQLRAGDGSLTGLPDALVSVAGASTATVLAVLSSWLAWSDRYLVRPVGRSWNPQRLEYAFALGARLSTGEVVLTADEYGTGTVDWYTFDAVSEPSLGSPAITVEPEAIDEVVIPTPVRYPGMPSDRLWALEDARVYLGGLDAGPTDLARLALVEFSLVFGTDWFLVPFDLPYGSVARVDRLVIRDTFGVEVHVNPSRDVGRPGWTVFQNTGLEDASWLADLFVFPATVRHVLEGSPLEEVALFRDELANLVWGVERIVQGASGEPVRRDRLPSSESIRQSIPDDIGDAMIVYRLMTPVPEHWLPFVAVPIQGRSAESFATELERRPMVRFLEDDTIEVAHPRGLLLRADPTGDVEADRLRVADEEIPREGVVLTRTMQLARTEGGGTVLWVGRRKRAGMGEGWSGLKFDTALPPGS